MSMSLFENKMSIYLSPFEPVLSSYNPSLWKQTPVTAAIEDTLSFEWIKLGRAKKESMKKICNLEIDGHCRG
jgi:hypothetical protein